MKFKNPVLNENIKSRDPVIVPGGDGYFYSCYNAVDRVMVRKFASLSEIETAEEKAAYVCTDESCPRDWYAPEMHLINGHWYIYGAPSIPEMPNIHGTYVLRSRTADAFGDYDFCGPLKGLESKWAIDATVFEYGGDWYSVISYNGLSIARLKDPVTLAHEPITIANAKLPWECVGSPIIEGPAALKRNGTLYIVYSASESGCDDYCLGILTFKGGEILDPANWEKHPEPVFSKANGLHGPGHCSFSVMNGRDVIVYHANPVSGTGWTGSFLCVQPFEWENDFPVFGEPLREFEL